MAVAVSIGSMRHCWLFATALQQLVALQGEEYDEVTSISSRLHDAIAGGSDDESQTGMRPIDSRALSGSDGAYFTDASEQFRPGSAGSSVSAFGRSP